jgi:uncharacterized protein DUF2800
MGVHSKRGPSQAKKFRACPGCFAMADSVPEQLRHGHGQAARLGTATHAVIEHCLKRGKRPDELRDRIVMVIETEEMDGASILKPGAKMPKPSADHYPFIVDDKMIEDADVAVDYVNGRIEELGSGVRLQLETRTNPLPDRDDTSGTADITLSSWPELLEVDDYKNGGLLVEHIDNDQARAYLVGKAEEYEWSFERYAAGIIQPNSPHTDGPVRVVEYTEAELKQFQKEYDADIKKCEKAEESFGKMPANVWEKLYLNAGEHCIFCEAGPACPARRKEAERLAAIEFADEPTEIQLPAVVKTGEVVGTTEEQVARILTWAPFLDQLVRAAELYAHRALEAGYEIPGFKLVARRSNRKLRDEPVEDLIKEMVEGGFITNDDVQMLYTRKLKSGPQIEKLVPKKKRKDFNERFLVKPDNGTTIARVDDVRSSVEPRAAADDFDDETEFG